MKRCALPLFLLFFCCAHIFCQAYADLPVDTQLRMILTALKYRNDFLPGLKDRIRIGLYYANNRAGIAYRDEMMRAFAEKYRNKTFFGVPVELDAFCEIPRLGEKPLHLLIVGDGCQPEIGRILAQTAAMKALTATGITRYLNSGISLIVGARDGKSFLAVNVENARRESCTFSPGLLQFATLVTGHE